MQIWGGFTRHFKSKNYDDSGNRKLAADKMRLGKHIESGLWFMIALSLCAVSVSALSLYFIQPLQQSKCVIIRSTPNSFIGYREAPCDQRNCTYPHHC